jgi:glutamate/tyrosine decarboxylase-like PLP-dependent enzyme
MINDDMRSEFTDANLFNEVASLGSQYIMDSEFRNVFPLPASLSNLEKFEEPLQNEFVSSHTILDMLRKYGAPATVAQVGGRYFGFVNGGIVPAGLVARLYTDFWDQNTAMEVISPVAAKLESVVQKWLVEIFGLPSSTVAGFVSGTSMATFCGLAAARYRILAKRNWDINVQGLFNAPRIRVVASR